jgi:hypothetical protein
VLHSRTSRRHTARDGGMSPRRFVTGSVSLRERRVFLEVE